MQVDLRSTQLRVLTLSFEPSLGSFDTRTLDAFLADKELLDVREHFFVVRDLPYLLCLLTYRVTTARPDQATSKPIRERQPLRVSIS
ncbi:MAG: hypothetical protein AB7I19_20115 [Planctomycetota bacterium]